MNSFSLIIRLFIVKQFFLLLNVLMQNADTKEVNVHVIEMHMTSLYGETLCSSVCRNCTAAAKTPCDTER